MSSFYWAGLSTREASEIHAALVLVYLCVISEDEFKERTGLNDRRARRIIDGDPGFEEVRLRALRVAREMWDNLEGDDVE